MTDDAKTPPRTPSAMQRLGLAVCPACEGRRTDAGESFACGYCEGSGRVTLARHHEYLGLKNLDRDDGDGGRKT